MQNKLLAMWFLFLLTGLSACSSAPVKERIVVKLVSDFCRLYNPENSWHPDDTQKTIDGVRRTNAKHKEKCK